MRWTCLILVWQRNHLLQFRDTLQKLKQVSLCFLCWRFWNSNICAAYILAVDYVYNNGNSAVYLTILKIVFVSLQFVPQISCLGGTKQSPTQIHKDSLILGISAEYQNLIVSGVFTRRDKWKIMSGKILKCNFRS